MTTSESSHGARGESHYRSLLKALSWRIVATTTTTIIAYSLTGSIKAAATIGSIEFFAKIPVYYGHERIWQLVPRGTIRQLQQMPESLNGTCSAVSKVESVTTS